MTVTRKLVTISLPAAADLSALQFTEVYMPPGAGDGLAATATATTDKPLGILLNKPAAAGRAAEVAIEGSVCKMVAGGTVDEGDEIMWGTGSKGIVLSGTAVWTIGTALTPAASGEIFEILVSPNYVPVS